MVCRQCGEEVSPYVTECPYCGTRLRKRAPKLTRGEEGLTPLESKRDKRRRKRRERAAERAEAMSRIGAADRPVGTIALIVAPAILFLAGSAASFDTGAIVGPVGDEPWRYATAPFSYPDVGYLFAAALGIAIFGRAIEERLGSVSTVLLAVAAGGLGMLAADGIESAINSSGLLVASGGNGMALGLLSAWAIIKSAEVRAGLDDHPEVIGAAIAAAVLVLLPLVEDFANVFAGLGGALVGVVCGMIAIAARGATNRD